MSLENFNFCVFQFLCQFLCLLRENSFLYTFCIGSKGVDPGPWRSDGSWDFQLARILFRPSTCAGMFLRNFKGIFLCFPFALHEFPPIYFPLHEFFVPHHPHTHHFSNVPSLILKTVHPLTSVTCVQ